MAKRKVLEKLSTQQLEKYITPDSRFVPEAIDFATEILRERGKQFTEEELRSIEELKVKNKNANSYSDEPIDFFRNENITDDSNALAIYPLWWIFIGSIFLTTLFGGILLTINFFKQKKYTIAIIGFILALSFFFIHQDLIEIFKQSGIKKQGRYSVSPELLSAFIGASMLLLLGYSSIPKKFPYRQADIWFPLILMLIFATLTYLQILP